MFFLGLLSTPMPYLLLAAFYFFGFAMGMFNNKTGDEASEPVASLTISAEVKENKIEQSVYYFQVNNYNTHQFQAKPARDTNSILDFVPDVGTSPLSRYYLKNYDFSFSNSLFCRPPPVVC